MGMISEERGNGWGIRLLVAILALTASRANFPISEWVKSVPVQATPTQAAVAHNKKKSEGVTPSRRFVESKNAGRLRKGESAPFPQLPTSDRSAELARSGQRILPSRVILARNPVTTPSYLQLFLRDSQVSSLPPPA
jgi:hypothetical protein